MTPTRRRGGGARLAVPVAVLALLEACLLAVPGILPPWEPAWYLPVHTAMETLAVVVAMLVFSTGAQPVDGRMPAIVAILSPAALAIGLLDGAHLLSVQGMPGLAGPGTAATGIGFWLAARAVSAAALFAAALVPADRTVSPRVHRGGVAAALALAALGYWLVLARPGLLPETYVPGRGMTAFKIGCEHAFVAVNAAAALLFLRRARGRMSRRDRDLAAAAAVMALGGAWFTVYRAPDDVLNMVGHVYKVIACLCLYRAIFVEAVQSPYTRLRSSERELAEHSSERRRLERALVDQLTHDALTGLPNRQRILEMLRDAIGTARRDGRALAVLVFDLDGFRKINGRFGWTIGDELLRTCMARLAERLAPRDTLARQGGNEFIIVQPDSGPEAATALALDLLGCMHPPFVLQGQQLTLTASIGIVMLPGRPCTAQDLLRMAQVAMAAARADGPGCLRIHTAAMEDAIRERIDFEAMLRHAAPRGQLALQFQPRLRLRTGEAAGAEALVRWRHPVLGLVPPGRFIPLAEETGLIEKIDLWVLREACTRAAGWLAAGVPLGRVSVNLSARQFQRAGLAQRVHATLAETGLPAQHLELEITEGTLMRDTEEASRVLRSLQALGVALSIDDFGTGYSSLSYLKRFPIDVLKIDRSFVQDVATSASDAAITRAIILLGHSLNLDVVAEGVETADQLDFLRENGCDEVQGYYFSRPVWPEDLPALLCDGVADAAQPS